MVDKLLEERGKRYGSFEDNARIMQGIKDIIRNDSDDLEPLQREALDMIAHKIGRILGGDANYIDSWRDISGFAQLVVKHLEKTDGASDLRVFNMQRVNGEWKEQI